jgi:serine/threonine protein kinase
MFKKAKTEANIQMNLYHPNIIGLYDAFTGEGPITAGKVFCLIMPLAERSFEKLMTTKLTDQQRMLYTKQIAEGLNYMHD